MDFLQKSIFEHKIKQANLILESYNVKDADVRKGISELALVENFGNDFITEYMYMRYCADLKKALDGGVISEEQYKERAIEVASLVPQQVVSESGNTYKVYVKDVSKANLSNSFGKEEDLIKGHLSYQLVSGEDSIKFAKRGGDVKSMAEAKKGKLNDIYTSLLADMQSKRKDIEEKGLNVEFKEEEYGIRCRWESEMSDSDRECCYKFNDLAYQANEIKNDIKILDVIIENIDDKKSYTLNATQIASLKN